MTENSFTGLLKNVVAGYAGYVTRLAKGFSSSSRIRATIKSTVEEKGEGVYTIRTSAGGANAKDARAREYGSGIHARRGVKKPYPIRPKKSGGVLVFAWDKANANIPRTRDGKVILKEVQHPGVEADQGGKGYIAPASIIARKKMKERLLKEGATSVRIDLMKSFKVK